MGFQVGGHPAFAVPFQPNEAYSDYEIRFDPTFSAERHLLSNEGLYNGETRWFWRHLTGFLFHMSFSAKTHWFLETFLQSQFGFSTRMG